MMSTANPPRAVSLYFTDLSAAVDHGLDLRI